jgi:MoxR-like ATPase
MEQSQEILRRHEHAEPPKSIDAQIELAALVEVQEEVRAVSVSEAARAYIAAVAHATRNHPAVQLPASPRATVSLLRCAQGFALTEGRGHVLPDDVKAVVVAVFAHRLGITAEDPEGVVAEIMQTVPVPLAP